MGKCFMKEREIFLYNIAWLRRHHGISKKKMAELLEIGVGSLNKMESGKMPPKLSVVVLFAVQDSFGIRPQDLLARRLGE